MTKRRQQREERERTEADERFQAMFAKMPREMGDSANGSSLREQFGSSKSAAPFLGPSLRPAFVHEKPTLNMNAGSQGQVPLWMLPESGNMPPCASMWMLTGGYGGADGEQKGTTAEHHDLTLQGWAISPSDIEICTHSDGSDWLLVSPPIPPPVPCPPPPPPLSPLSP